MNHSINSIKDKLKGLDDVLSSLSDVSSLSETFIKENENISETEKLKIRQLVESGELKRFADTNPSIESINEYVKSL